MSKKSNSGKNNYYNGSTTFSIYEVIVIVLVAILFGIVIGYVITFTHSSFSSINNNPKLKELITVYDDIVDEYYDEVDEDSLIDIAIKAMIDSLDDEHTKFIDSNSTSDFNELVDGAFVGIGITVQFENEYNRIVEVNEDGPAYSAGLRVGDIITYVSGNDAYNMNSNDLSSLVRGKEGTVVNITVDRDGEEFNFDVVRSIVEIDVVEGDIINIEDKDIGYIKINTFSANSYNQFNNILTDYEEKGISSLIIDVRGNPGGHLKQVTDILSLFFNKKVVLYQIENKGKVEKIKSKNNDVRKYPIAVLINGASASASEILASCFQDNYSKSIIVGNTSYGKGTVQKSKSLISGSTIKYTTEKWLTSKGKYLNKKGVVPDYVIEQSDEYYEEDSYENDTQLQFALEKLK